MTTGQKQSAAPKRAEDLSCNETIDPATVADLSQESIPGVWHLNSNESLHPGSRPTSFRTDLEPEDVKLVNELGRLSADQLMEYIRHLQSSAFSLGIEESKQFNKAKVLQIFKPRDV